MTSNFKYIKAAPVALVALTAALLQPLAYAQSPTTPTPSTTPSTDSMKGGKTDSSTMPGSGGMGMKGMNMDMQAMMKEHNDKMSSMKMSGNADVDFAMMMRMHHQGGIDMAQTEMRDGKSPEMRKMAKNIVAAQEREIAQLDRFLAKNGHPIAKMAK